MHELAVFHGEALGRYAFPDPHPFGSDRLPAFWREFTKRNLAARVDVREPVDVADSAIEAFHTREYVLFVRESCRKGTGLLDQGDTPALKGVFEAARTVVGTTLAAVSGVLAGTFRRAFSPVAGLHHAFRDRASGFCVFNDVGVAILHLRAQGVRRIAYVDVDAHHGDGVFYEFEDDPELFVCDTHEDGRFLFPGTGFAHETGKGAAKGTKRNFPLAPGSGEDEFMTCWTEIESFLDAAAPEFFLLQCGADSLAGDPISHLRLTSACHRHAATRLRALAEKHGRGRLVAMGGGGYDRANLADAWCEVVEALA